MTARADMTAAGFGLMDLLTVPETARRLGRSVKFVRRLAAEDPPVLVLVRFGSLVRVTPESVAAYEQQQAAKAAGAP